MKQADEFAVRVNHVSKDFKLPHENISTVKGLFTNKLFRKNRHGYKVQHALQDISFEVKKGEFFGIVGRNGSGKSTLLKMLAGVYQPNSGRITTVGKLVPFIELGVGFNPELTGRENVYLNGALMGFTKKQIDGQYDHIVAFAELKDFMDQKLKNYSSGMQVRLAFSVATTAKADILLIDEVLAVGDADFQRKCFDYFKKLKGSETTVIFVTHDMNAVREYCDGAALIEKSHLVTIGTAAKVAGEYSKLFLAKDDEGKQKLSENGKKKLERWGDASAEILSPKIIKTDKDKLRLEFILKAKQDIQDPIVGYYFTDSLDKQICGTNTQILGSFIGPYVKGKEYKITFDMINVFNDGDYKVTIAALRNNGSVIADWWVDAAELTIKKAQHIPYVIDLPVEFSWEVHS
ncbi:MAG: ABC transporter ATP-binding protein [Patescibacteria group bacterium]